MKYNALVSIVLTLLVGKDIVATPSSQHAAPPSTSNRLNDETTLSTHANMVHNLEKRVRKDAKGRTLNPLGNGDHAANQQRKIQEREREARVKAEEKATKEREAAVPKPQHITSKPKNLTGRTKGNVEQAIKRAKNQNFNNNGQGHPRDGTEFENKDNQLPQGKKYIELGIDSGRSRRGQNNFKNEKVFNPTDQQRVVVGGKYDTKGRFKQKGGIVTTSDHYVNLKPVKKNRLRT